MSLYLSDYEAAYEDKETTGELAAELHSTLPSWSWLSKHKMRNNKGKNVTCRKKTENKMRRKEMLKEKEVRKQKRIRPERRV